MSAKTPKTLPIVFIVLASSALFLQSCKNDLLPAEQNKKVNWNPPSHTEFHLIDKDSTGSLAHLQVSPNLDSIAIHQLVYVAVNNDIYIVSKQMRLQLTNTLCIRNVSVDNPIIVNAVEYYDAEGVKLKDFLDHSVELRPLQSIWLILDGEKEHGGTGTNFLVDWASEKPVKSPIIESLMAGSSYQLGFSYKSESVVVKEWRYGVETDVEDL